jgi:hypothetical protein
MSASSWARFHKSTFQRLPCRPICKHLATHKCKAPSCAMLCTFGALCAAFQACSLLGSTDLSHYSLLRWLPPSATGRGSSMRGSVGSVAPSPPLQPSAQLSQLYCTDADGADALQRLADDVECYERVRELGFVRGVLLPVRNALGDAARVGALLEEGPGPYNKTAGQVSCDSSRI